MSYPRIIFGDRVCDFEYRVVVRIERDDLKFLFEKSNQIDSMGNFIWSPIEFKTFLFPTNDLDYERMNRILSAIIKERTVLSTINDAKIIE